MATREHRAAEPRPNSRGPDQPPRRDDRREKPESLTAKSAKNSRRKGIGMISWSVIRPDSGSKLRALHTLRDLLRALISSQPTSKFDYFVQRTQKNSSRLESPCSLFPWFPSVRFLNRSGKGLSRLTPSLPGSGSSGRYKSRPPGTAGIVASHSREHGRGIRHVLRSAWRCR